MSNISLSPPTPSQTEAQMCSTMGESTRSSSVYNPTLSANKHVQICRFSLSAAADLADGSHDRQRRRTKLKRHWKIVQSCRSPSLRPSPLQCTVSWFQQRCLCTSRRGACERISTIQAVLKLGAELLPFEQEKYINLVCSSCLKHANEMPLGDPRQADQRTQSFNFSIIIHLSLDPTTQARRSLSLHVAWFIESVFYIPLSCTSERTRSSTWVSSHSVTESTVRLRMRRVYAWSR